MPFISRTQFQQQALSPTPIVPEVVTEDKWHQPWVDPVRLKIAGALAIALMTSGLVETLTPPLQAEITTSSSPVFFQSSFQYQSFASPVLPPETVTVDKWTYPWASPVRQKIISASLQQQAIIQGPLQTPETINEDKWNFKWSMPVRQKIGLGLSLHQTLAAPVFTPTPAAPQQTSISSLVNVNVQYESRTQYQAQAQPVFVPPPSAADIAVISTTSVQVTFNKSFPYQAKVQPVFAPETVTVDKWTYSWSEPVRQKPGLIASLQQALAAPVLTNDQITGTIEARWHQPWSEPVRTRRFPTSEQQAQIQGPQQTPEFITVDKWIYPWSEPVKQKVGLKTNLQQAYIDPALDDETQIINTFESRWHYPWSEPVRIKPQVPAGEQQTVIQGPVQTPEFITVDKWIYAWSEPVRQKIGLKAHLQQAFIAPVLDDETQLIQGFESRWHYAWSEPVRFRVLATAQQQTLAFQPPSFEILTIDKWGFAWSEPVRQKPGLRASLQQTLVQTVLDPDTQITQNYESRWHFAWSEPVRVKPQVPAGEQQALIQGPVQTPEFITVDKWIYGWTDPVRQKIGLRASLQQALIAPVLADEQLTGTIESRWHQPWSEPVRFRRFPTAAQQSYAAPATSVFETVTVDKWVYPWTDPVKQKLGLKTNLQQSFIGTTLEPNTQIIQTYESRWHQPWSTPTLRKVSVASQPAGAWSTFTPTAETITVDKWFESFSDPVRLKIGLAVNLQQTFTAPVIPNPIVIPSASSPVIFNRAFQYPSLAHSPFVPPEVVTLDKWLYQLSEPVRFRIDPRRAIALAAPSAIGPVLNPNTQITQNFESRWHFAWSEPKRFKAGLGAWLQDTTTPKTPIFPTGVVRLNQWFAPLSQPVRLKIGLGAVLQQFFEIDTKPPALGPITLTLSATETNSDSAFFGVTVYNAVPVVSRVPTTVVSIKEIPAVRKADVSTEEVPAIDNASVSIEET